MSRSADRELELAQSLIGTQLAERRGTLAQLLTALGGAAVVSFALLSVARAQEAAPSPPAAEASRSAERGELLPFSAAPFVDARVTKLRAGYDAASDHADVQAEVAAPVTSWLALRAGAAHDGLGDATRPFGFALVSLLREAESGIALGALGGFEARGFNTVPNVVVGLTLSERVGPLLLLSGATYGQALTGPERNGRVQLAALTRLTDHLQIGLDSRGELDLERDADEPAGEPDWRARGGPLATVTLGAFALSAGAGVAALRYRLAPSTSLGGMGYAALGAAF